MLGLPILFVACAIKESLPKRWGGGGGGGEGMFPCSQQNVPCVPSVPKHFFFILVFPVP